MDDKTFNRWKSDFNKKIMYTPRIQQMSKYVSTMSTVLDIGCGQKELKDFIPNNCNYFGIDLFKKDKNDLEIVISDLNKEFPKLQYDYFDFVICSGIIEYILDVDKFIENISKLTDNLIISYCCKEDYNDEIRLRNMWVNNFTKLEFIKLLKKYNFNVNNEEICFSRQKIFNCVKNKI